jgi:hypothetical protein
MTKSKFRSLIGNIIGSTYDFYNAYGLGKEEYY